MTIVAIAGSIPEDQRKSLRHLFESNKLNARTSSLPRKVVKHILELSSSPPEEIPLWTLDVLQKTYKGYAETLSEETQARLRRECVDVLGVNGKTPAQLVIAHIEPAKPWGYCAKACATVANITFVDIARPGVLGNLLQSYELF